MVNSKGGNTFDSAGTRDGYSEYYAQEGSEYDAYPQEGVYGSEGYADMCTQQGGDGSEEYHDYYKDSGYAATDQEGASYGSDGNEAPPVEVEYEIPPLEEFEWNFSNWRVYESEEGLPYYLDTSSQHSQWEDPRVCGLVMPGEEYGDAAWPVEGGDADWQDAYDPSGAGCEFTRPRRITPKKPTPKKSTPNKSTPQKHAEARAKRSKPQRVVVDMTPPRRPPADVFSSSDEDGIRMHMAGHSDRRLPDGRGMVSKGREDPGPSTPANSPLPRKLAVKSMSTSDVLSPDVLQGPPLAALGAPSTKKKSRKIVLMDASPRKHAFGETEGGGVNQSPLESPSRSAVHLASTLQRSLTLNSPRRPPESMFLRRRDDGDDEAQREPPLRPSSTSDIYDDGSDWDVAEEEAGLGGHPVRSRWDFEEEAYGHGKAGHSGFNGRERARTAPQEASYPSSSRQAEGRGRIYTPEDGAYGSGGNKFH